MYKDIHIGHLILVKWKELDFSIERACNFFKISKTDVENMFSQKSLDTELLLKWSKLLEYDFFRIYSQHLILYSPPSKRTNAESLKSKKLPEFRKNIYTQEIIEFILEKKNSDEMSKNEVIEKYKIPKTTLHKWISKYSK